VTCVFADVARPSGEGVGSSVAMGREPRVIAL